MIGGSTEVIPTNAPHSMEKNTHKNLGIFLDLEQSWIGLDSF